MEGSEENDMKSRHPELWDEPDYIRKEMAHTMGHIYSHGMTTTSGGNMSVMDSLGNIWITPSGTDKGSLKPGEVVCVAPDGTSEGQLKPSMEYPLHRAVYDARSDIRAIIHAHPPMLTSFSIVHRIPDTSILNGWREICGSVGYAVYATPSSWEMGENVAAEFRKGHDAVIMENHAAVAGGKDLAEALARLEAMEYCARTIHAAAVIGEIRIPDNIQNENSELPSGNQMPQSGPRSRPGESASVTTPENELLAEEICRMTTRACDRGLMYGYCGTVSARAGGDRFLITGERILRCNIVKHEIDTVNYVVNGNNDEPAGDTDDAGGRNRVDDEIRTGTTGNGLHTWLQAEIYRRFPSINAIITAQPPCLMTFAVTGKEIDVRTIPESWLLLQELPSVALGTLQHGREDIFNCLAKGNPAVLIRNDSVIVTGESLLQAFDRLEVAEMTAMSLVLARQIGEVKSISEEQIEVLKSTFLK